MIKMSALTGPHAGKTRDATGVNPKIIWEFLNEGWEWAIDYSEATPEEGFVWLRIDFVARVVRALKNGLTVEFEGVKYTATEETWEQVAQTIEDTVGNSGKLITLGHDDERGLLIASVGHVM